MTIGHCDGAILATIFGNFGLPTEAFLRLLLAAVCGGVIGIEREMRGRQAGFRTNLLVCIGSALVMIVSIAVAEMTVTMDSPLHDHININTDPGRIAYGVMGGIGFLGAGTIIHNKGSIRGLTTAAALWCVAALGLAAGLGLYTVTTMATLMIVVVLWILSYIEPLIPQTRYRQIVVRTDWSPNCIPEVVSYLKTRGLRVIDVSFDRREDPAFAVVTLVIAFKDAHQFFHLERAVEGERKFELLATRETQQ